MRKMRSGVEIEMFQKNLATKLRWIYQIFEDDVGYKHEEHKQDLKLSQSEEIEYWVNKPSQKRVISPHTYSIRSSTSPDHPRKIPPAGNDHRPPSLLVCSRVCYPSTSKKRYLLFITKAFYNNLGHYFYKARFNQSPIREDQIQMMR